MKDNFAFWESSALVPLCYQVLFVIASGGLATTTVRGIERGL